ncbi:MAG: cysteine desulfurase [Lachnospiraceae bacterium]|nr:cysteine desulfurase [Lachnospiraceae bacterium]
MECYLDNSATTAVDEEAAALMGELMTKGYGNPSSLHNIGFEAQKKLDEAAKGLSKILKCRENELIFTSGGTESNNTAIIGSYLANTRREKHIITTAIEHPSVRRPADFLETLGCRVDILGVDANGHIDLDELKSLLRPDTLLVSIMHVNNETGAVQPIAEAGKIIKEVSEGCIFHVDDVQGFGKLRLIPKEAGVDLLSVSAHKLHGPKGSGLLYARSGVRLSPIIFGGGQQGGKRSGTENVPGAAGLSFCAKKLYADLDGNLEKLQKLRSVLLNGLEGLEGISVNGGDAPYIISLTVQDVRAEVLLHALEQNGIYVSAGSACSSHKKNSVSPTLMAMGLSEKDASSTIRISTCCKNTEEEMLYTAEVMKKEIKNLRRFVQR